MPAIALGSTPTSYGSANDEPWGFDRVVAVKISNDKITTFAFTNSIKESQATS